MSSTGDLPERREGRAYGVPSRRVRVIQLLTDAYARDELEQAEFERRVELAEHAATMEELDRLLADFPDDVVRALRSPLASGAAGTAPASAGGIRLSRDEIEREVQRLDGLSAPTRLNLVGDQHIVAGPDDPRVVRSLSVIGDCTVDLRELAGAPGVFLVKVGAVIGDTTVVVPRGTPVEMRLFALIGDQKRAPVGGGVMKRLARKLGLVEEPKGPPAPPGPAVVVTGFRLIGDTVVVEE